MPQGNGSAFPSFYQIGSGFCAQSAYKSLDFGKIRRGDAHEVRALRGHSRYHLSIYSLSGLVWLMSPLDKKTRDTDLKGSLNNGEKAVGHSKTTEVLDAGTTTQS